MNLASWKKRALNAIFDSIIIYILMRLIFVTFLSSIMSKDAYATLMLSSIGKIIPYAFFFCYYIIFEGALQKTPAKFITKTSVVWIDGKRITDLNSLFKRTIFRYIPFEFLSFFDKYPVGWHDSWSNTRVINDK
ncbi:MAG: RDD family protein [Candidatus Jacksonbacteria bacterium]